MARLIDLSMPIKDHWRWPVKVETTRRTEGEGYTQSSTVQLRAHAFTHVDAPLHFVKGGGSIDEIPLTHLTGRGAVIDVSHRGVNAEITSSDLDKKGGHVAEGDIALLKTAWDAKVSWNDERFWTDSPYLAEDAAQWLVSRRVKAAGYDFPQDYVIRQMLGGTPSVQAFRIHNILLPRGILNIEYLINLHQIRAKTVQLFALPLKLVGVEGAPARVIALEEYC